MIRSSKKREGARIVTLTSLLCLSLASVVLAEPASHRDQDRPPPHGRRPPPEAFSACEGKSEGAECTVSFRERTLEGVCVAPESDSLFCMPNDLPPPPSDRAPPNAR